MTDKTEKPERIERANQDQLLEYAIENSKILTFFLRSGVPIKGRVVAHDLHTVLIKTEKNQTLAYKHSITSIFPARFAAPRSS